MPSLNNLTFKPPKVNKHLSICPLSPFDLLFVKLRYTFKIFNLIQNRFFNLLKRLLHFRNFRSTHFTKLVNFIVQ
jgi:hypothetical protein